MMRKAAAIIAAILMMLANTSMAIGAAGAEGNVEAAETTSNTEPAVTVESTEKAEGSEPQQEADEAKFYEAIPLAPELQDAMFAACEDFGIEPAIMLGLIETESGFRTDAVSAAGCYGLCQLNPAYFPSGLSAAENIRTGVEYLSQQINAYGGTEEGLTAYNAGHDTGSRTYAAAVLERAARWARVIEETV